MTISTLWGGVGRWREHAGAGWRGKAEGEEENLKQPPHPSQAHLRVLSHDLS